MIQSNIFVQTDPMHGPYALLRMETRKKVHRVPPRMAIHFSFFKNYEARGVGARGEADRPTARAPPPGTHNLRKMDSPRGVP